MEVSSAEGSKDFSFHGAGKIALNSMRFCFVDMPISLGYTWFPALGRNRKKTPKRKPRPFVLFVVRKAVRALSPLGVDVSTC